MALPITLQTNLSGLFFLTSQLSEKVTEKLPEVEEIDAFGDKWPGKSSAVVSDDVWLLHEARWRPLTSYESQRGNDTYSSGGSIKWQLQHGSERGYQGAVNAVQRSPADCNDWKRVKRNALGVRNCDEEFQYIYKQTK